MTHRNNSPVTLRGQDSMASFSRYILENSAFSHLGVTLWALGRHCYSKTRCNIASVVDITTWRFPRHLYTILFLLNLQPLVSPQPSFYVFRPSTAILRAGAGSTSARDHRSARLESEMPCLFSLVLTVSWQPMLIKAFSLAPVTRGTIQRKSERLFLLFS